ncbi:unnamed protein product, partial [Ixodes hexagonus]
MLKAQDRGTCFRRKNVVPKRVAFADDVVAGGGSDDAGETSKSSPDAGRSNTGGVPVPPLGRGAVRKQLKVKY